MSAVTPLYQDPEGGIDLKPGDWAMVDNGEHRGRTVEIVERLPSGMYLVRYEFYATIGSPIDEVQAKIPARFLWRI